MRKLIVMLSVLVVVTIGWVAYQLVTGSDQPAATQPVYQAKHLPVLKPSVEPGATARVDEPKWIDYMELKGIAPDGISGIIQRETCVLKFGGLVTVQMENDQAVVVSYDHGSWEGTACDPGTQFTMSKASFIGMDARYVARYNEIEDEKALVSRLLANNYYGEKSSAGEWHWVDVVNLTPVEQQFRGSTGTLRYGDTCGAGSPSGTDSGSGTIQVRGEGNGKTLYEYTADGDVYGTPCPSGVLFFGDSR